MLKKFADFFLNLITVNKKVSLLCFAVHFPGICCCYCLSLVFHWLSEDVQYSGPQVYTVFLRDRNIAGKQ